MTAPKRPFDIDQVIRRIRVATRPFPKAAMFELADDGFSSPFEQLVACIISIRTRDEVTIPTARRLFARARTPLEASRLTSREIDQLIRACAEMRQPRAGNRLRSAARRRRHTRSSRHQPLGIRQDANARADFRRARKQAPAPLPGRGQPPARPVRQTHLHGRAAAMLGMPRARILPAGGR